jgi:hypothetical protein
MSKSKVIGCVFSVLVAVTAAYAATHLMLKNRPQIQVTKVFTPPFTAAEIATIAPHKAVYKIEMVQKSSSAQVSNISGQMYFEWRPVCGAWTTKHRFGLVYDYAESPQLRIASDFTTYESITGDSFDFSSRRRRDGEVYEDLRGHAELSANGGAGKALYTLPQGTSFDLPAGTLFPMAHTLAVIKAAHEGKKFFRATIFDGSDEDGPVEVNAFIGAPVSPLALAVSGSNIDPSLLTSPARHIRLAFFPLKDPEADSDYEMDLILHDNGIISDMRVDYKDFSVTQKLAGLESVKAETCPVKMP